MVQTCMLCINNNFCALQLCVGSWGVCSPELRFKVYTETADITSPNKIRWHKLVKGEMFSKWLTGVNAWLQCTNKL